MALLDGYSLAWIVALAAALLATGMVAGMLAGMLGVGGGIVIVPVLYHVFTLLQLDESVRMHVAVGTSLATIVPTSVMSARAHWRKGNLDFTLLKKLVPTVMVGVLLGSVLSGHIGGASLSAVFAVVALLVALYMAFQREGARLSQRLPGAAGTAGMGLSIGGLSTLMGIGGGTLSVPLLHAFNTPMHVAVGTGAALGMFISLPGALAFAINGFGASGVPPASIGYVNLLGLALIVPATLLTTPWGARMAHTMHAPLLRKVFAGFLALTSARMFYGLVS